MKFDILTIFPAAFDSYFNESIIKRAKEKKKIKINIHNIRDNTTDKHKTVDDTPYGGGPGMLMKIEPIYKTLKKIRKSKKSKIILFTPTGKQLDQKMVNSFAKLDQLVMICGHYEGIDSRIDKFIDEKVSIGNYVLTNGNIPAMIMVDSITRLLPGVLHNEESFKQDTFYDDNDLEYPQYTKPEVFKYRKDNKVVSLKVPSVLVSGNHKLIEEWRKKHTKAIKK
jgi:tRNA (guanine37-N1)-methyltransferase